MIKKVWRLETGIFVGTWLLLMVCASSSLLRDPGTFTHTVVGERILSTGQLIYTDPFSFTYGGKYWIANQWLGECIMALIHRVAGLDSLLLATVTLLAFFYTWMAHRLVRVGIHPLLAVLIISLAAAASSHHFHIRPHLATIVFLGFSLAMLCDFEAGHISIGRLFWLAPLFLLWANIHGGFLGGMGTLFLVTAGWIFAWLAGGESPISGIRQALVLVVIVIACGLTAFVNPYGVELPTAWLSIMNLPLLPQIIMEHAPLASSKTALAVLPLGLLYMAALIGVFPRRPRVTWFIPLVWLYLAWTRVRHAPLFATAFAIVIADMLPHVRWVKWLSQRGSEVCKIRTAHQMEISNGITITQTFIPIILILTTITFQVAGVRLPVFGSGWAKPDPAHWPIGLLGELKRIESQRPIGTPIFNDFLYGGFLIYYTPRMRIFIDDRCELYGAEGLSMYMNLEDAPDQINRLAEEYGSEFALVKSASRFDRYLSEAKNWSLLKRVDAAVLYQRNSKAHMALPP